MNKLEEIMKANKSSGGGFSLFNSEETKKIAIAFGKHLLEEAAENANTELIFKLNGDRYDVINKESIKEVIKKYELCK